jgi:ABC-type multidrug transport system permease subunit
VVEKKFTPMQAIILSIKALRFKILHLLLIYFILLMALISLLLPVSLLLSSSLAPIAIMVFLYGLSYVAPWYYNVKGILYREIFGVFVDKNTVTDNTNLIENNASDNSTDDTFSA